MHPRAPRDGAGNHRNPACGLHTSHAYTDAASARRRFEPEEVTPMKVLNEIGSRKTDLSVRFPKPIGSRHSAYDQGTRAREDAAIHDVKRLSPHGTMADALKPLAEEMS